MKIPEKNILHYKHRKFYSADPTVGDLSISCTLSMHVYIQVNILEETQMMSKMHIGKNVSCNKGAHRFIYIIKIIISLLFSPRLLR